MTSTLSLSLGYNAKQTACHWRPVCDVLAVLVVDSIAKFSNGGVTTRPDGRSWLVDIVSVNAESFEP